MRSNLRGTIRLFDRSGRSWILKSWNQGPGAEPNDPDDPEIMNLTEEQGVDFWSRQS